MADGKGYPPFLKIPDRTGEIRKLPAGKLFTVPTLIGYGKMGKDAFRRKPGKRQASFISSRAFPSR